MKQFFQSTKSLFSNFASWLRRRVPGVTESVIASIIVTILAAIIGLGVTFLIHIIPTLTDKLHWLLQFLHEYRFLSTVVITLILVILIISIGILIWQRKRILSWPLNTQLGADFNSFISDVSINFEAKGFSIENIKIDGIDIIGTSISGSPSRRIAIIVERNSNVVLTKNNIKDLLVVLKRNRIDLCYYIARSSHPFFIDRKIVNICRNRINFTSYRDFVLKGSNFEPYLNRLVADWEGSKAGKTYVEMSGRDEEGKMHKPLDTFLDDMLSSLGGKIRVILLGDFGTGKTIFLRYYASVLAQRHLQSQIENPIPIFISLKDYELVGNLEQLISRELNQYGVTTTLSIPRDIQLGRKIFLILDAFDEMSLNVDRISVQRNLRSIEDIVSSQTTAFIISCRKHFFRDSVEEGQLRYFYPIYLEPWGKVELTDYLQKTAGDRWKASLKVIKETHNLEELARTPLFLNMIVDSIESLTHQKVLSAELYTTYTNKWINAQIYKTVLDRDQKAEFMEELSWKMMVEGRRFIPWPELRNTIQIRYQLSFSDVDRFDNDIRTCSFLSRSTASSSYAFSHNSFLEFFVSKHVFKNIDNEKIDPLCKIELPYEVTSFLAQLLDSPIYYERLHLWLEFKSEQEFALARRNVAHILRLISQSSLPTESNKAKLQKISEQTNIILSNSDADTRWRAIVALGWLRSSDSVSILERILSGKEEEIRILRIAAVVLGLLGNRSTNLVLTRLLREGKSIVLRQNCAVGLGLLGNTFAIPDLVDSLQQEEDHRVRRSTIWAIETIDPMMARSALADRALRDSSEEVRQYAALALGRVGGNEALDVLENVLKDPSRLVRRAALEAIGRIGGDKALHLAENLLNDPDVVVRDASKYAVNLIKSI